MSIVKSTLLILLLFSFQNLNAMPVDCMERGNTVILTIDQKMNRIDELLGGELTLDAKTDLQKLSDSFRFAKGFVSTAVTNNCSKIDLQWKASIVRTIGFAKSDIIDQIKMGKDLPSGPAQPSDDFLRNEVVALDQALDSILSFIDNLN